MMKKLTYFIIGILMAVGTVSCELDDNIDPKFPSEVPAETLFTSAQISLVDQYNSMSVNRNISRLLAQYWMETTYTNESRYDFLDRGIPDAFWQELYRDCLMDFKEAKRLINDAVAKGALEQSAAVNQIAIIEINEIFVWSWLVETFGNIPYTDALNALENTLPAYDDGQTVYIDLFKRLDAAIAALNPDAKSLETGDLLFDGDIDAWKMFGNTLKLRMGMRMADVDAIDSKTIVEEAVTAGVYDANSEGAFFKYIGTEPYQNTIYEGFFVDGRKDYVPSNTYIDKLLALNDPRLPLLFTQIDGEYKGLEYGKTKGGKYDDYSHFSQMFFEPTLEVIMADYSEVEFYLAEAVERGYNVGGTAEEHYNNAITANILYWGGTEEDANDYLAKPEVAYATAAGDWKEKIGTQKWIAMYNRGVEGWSEWRRLDYPILNVPEGMTYGDIPVRYPYPFDENDMNEANYNAAATAIGGDKATTKLFWDKN